MNSLEELKTALSSIEISVLGTDLSTKNTLEGVQDRIDEISHILSKVPLGPNLGNRSLHQIYSQVRRIEAVAVSFLELEKSYQSNRSNLVDKSRQLLDSTRSKTSSNTVRKNQQVVLTGSDCLPSHHLRQYFLDHITGPYPNQRDKDHMLDKTNNDIMASNTNRKPMTPSQLTLWFINARRRSGWSQIMQKYGKNDRSFTKQLAEEILRLKKRFGDETKIDTDDRECIPLSRLLNEGKDPTSEKSLERVAEFEKDWDAMVDWIRVGAKERVGDWVELVAKAAAAQKRNKSSTIRKQHVAQTTVSKGRKATITTNTKSKDKGKNTRTTRASDRVRCKPDYRESSTTDFETDDDDEEEWQRPCTLQAPIVTTPPVKVEHSASPPDYGTLGLSLGLGRPSAQSAKPGYTRYCSADSSASFSSTEGSEVSSLGFNAQFYNNATLGSSTSSFASFDEPAFPFFSPKDKGLGAESTAINYRPNKPLPSSKVSKGTLPSSTSTSTGTETGTDAPFVSFNQPDTEHFASICFGEMTPTPRAQDFFVSPLVASPHSRSSTASTLDYAFGTWTATPAPASSQ